MPVDVAPSAAIPPCSHTELATSIVNAAFNTLQRGDCEGSAKAFHSESQAEITGQFAAVLSSRELRSVLITRVRARIARLLPAAFVETAMLAFDRFEGVRRNWPTSPALR